MQRPDYRMHAEEYLLVWMLLCTQWVGCCTTVLAICHTIVVALQCPKKIILSDISSMPCLTRMFSSDVGGALRLGGNTTIRECHFVSNLASRSGPAIGAVGMTAISDSHFKGNTFFCQEKKFLRENPTVSKASGFSVRLVNKCLDVKRTTTNGVLFQVTRTKREPFYCCFSWKFVPPTFVPYERAGSILLYL